MSSSLVADQLVASRYRLVEAYEGAPAGERWRALDAESNNPVVLTWLSPPRPRAVEESRAVVSALRGFSHPHAAKITDSGTHADLPWLVTAPPAGSSLAAWLADAPGGVTAVPLRDVRAVLEQITHCLAAAHRGVGGISLTHGAPLAASVFVERRGSQVVAALTDLGARSLARVADADVDAEEPPGVADDVYGVGALVAAMLTGESPSGREDIDATLKRLVATRPDVDPSIWQIARACTAEPPSARPDGIARVRDLIRRANWTPREVRAPEPPRREAPREAPSPAPAPAPLMRARIFDVRVETPAASAERPKLTPPPPPPPPPAEPRSDETSLAVVLPEAEGAQGPTGTLVPRRSAMPAEPRPPVDPDDFTEDTMPSSVLEPPSPEMDEATRPIALPDEDVKSTLRAPRPSALPKYAPPTPPPTLDDDDPFARSRPPPTLPPPRPSRDAPPQRFTPNDAPAETSSPAVKYLVTALLAALLLSLALASMSASR